MGAENEDFSDHIIPLMDDSLFRGILDCAGHCQVSDRHSTGGAFLEREMVVHSVERIQVRELPIRSAPDALETMGHFDPPPLGWIRVLRPSICVAVLRVPLTLRKGTR